MSKKKGELARFDNLGLSWIYIKTSPSYSIFVSSTNTNLGRHVHLNSKNQYYTVGLVPRNKFKTPTNGISGGLTKTEIKEIEEKIDDFLDGKDRLTIKSLKLVPRYVSDDDDRDLVESGAETDESHFNEVSKTSKIDQIKELKLLLNRGDIDKGEYDALKTEIIEENGGNSPKGSGEKFVNKNNNNSCKNNNFSEDVVIAVPETQFKKPEKVDIQARISCDSIKNITEDLRLWKRYNSARGARSCRQQWTDLAGLIKNNTLADITYACVEADLNLLSVKSTDTDYANAIREFWKLTSQDQNATFYRVKEQQVNDLKSMKLKTSTHSDIVNFVATYRGRFKLARSSNTITKNIDTDPSNDDLIDELRTTLYEKSLPVDVIKALAPDYDESTTTIEDILLAMSKFAKRQLVLQNLGANNNNSTAGAFNNKELEEVGAVDKGNNNNNKGFGKPGGKYINGKGDAGKKGFRPKGKGVEQGICWWFAQTGYCPYDRPGYPCRFTHKKGKGGKAPAKGKSKGVYVVEEIHQIDDTYNQPEENEWPEWQWDDPYNPADDECWETAENLFNDNTVGVIDLIPNTNSSSNTDSNNPFTKPEDENAVDLAWGKEDENIMVLEEKPQKPMQQVNFQLDSGACMFVVSSPKFLGIQKVFGEKLQAANKSEINATHIGYISGSINGHKFTLNNAVLCPDVNKELFSTFQAVDQLNWLDRSTEGYLVIPSAGSIPVFRRGNKGFINLKIDIHSNNASRIPKSLCMINDLYNETPHESSHHMDGHSEKCDVCPGSKHRARIQKEPILDRPMQKPEELGDLGVMDAGGPYTKTKYRNRKYAFLCSCPVIGWSELLCRCERQGAGILLYSLWEQEVGSLKYVLPDNAPEFSSNNFREKLKEANCKRLPSSDYAHLQHCHIEGRLSTLLSDSRTAALSAGMDGELYWNFAMELMVFVRNRTPRRGMQNYNKSPFEARFNSKPDVSKIRPFGAYCWLLPPKELQLTRDKTFLRSKPGRFLCVNSRKRQFVVESGGEIIEGTHIKFVEKLCVDPDSVLIHKSALKHDHLGGLKTNSNENNENTGSEILATTNKNNNTGNPGGNFTSNSFNTAAATKKKPKTKAEAHEWELQKHNKNETFSDPVDDEVERWTRHNPILHTQLLDKEKYDQHGDEYFSTRAICFGNLQKVKGQSGVALGDTASVESTRLVVADGIINSKDFNTGDSEGAHLQGTYVEPALPGEDKPAVPIIRLPAEWGGKIQAVRKGFNGLYLSNFNWEKRRDGKFSEHGFYPNVRDGSLMVPFKTTFTTGGDVKYENTTDRQNFILTHVDDYLESIQPGKTSVLYDLAADLAISFDKPIKFQHRGFTVIVFMHLNQEYIYIPECNAAATSQIRFTRKIKNKFSSLVDTAGKPFTAKSPCDPNIHEEVRVAMQNGEEVTEEGKKEQHVNMGNMNYFPTHTRIELKCSCRVLSSLKPYNCVRKISEN